MAIELAQQNNFELIKNILQNSQEEEYNNSLIRKGLLAFDPNLNSKLGDEELNTTRSPKSDGKDPDPI